MMRQWLVRVADRAQDTAKRILESDLEQAAMILTTLVASTTYGWIEGFAIETPRYQATQIWWILGHFSTYSFAMGVMFACITGSFGLLKARSMFARGKRYFLFTFAGNFPFSWLVEDFAFFWFSPEWRLTSDRWTNWILGGIWILDPWRTGIQIWIPNWYWPVLAFWACMMWYAHRCTVYDNLVKDEIAREIVPRKIEIPHVEVKKPVRTSEEAAERRDASAEEKLQTPEAEHVRAEPERSSTEQPIPEQKSPPRSVEAEEALKKLRSRILKDA
jgi:hypothetical protein